MAEDLAWPDAGLLGVLYRRAGLLGGAGAVELVNSRKSPSASPQCTFSWPLMTKSCSGRPFADFGLFEERKKMSPLQRINPDGDLLAFAGETFDQKPRHL